MYLLVHLPLLTIKSGDKVEGGTIASITISQLAGAMDCNSQAMTNVDINSGAVNGTPIGAIMTN